MFGEENLALPVKAYVAGKRLNTNDFASPDSDVRHFYSRPLQESLEPQSLGEERRHFFIALSRGNEKGSPPQAGSLLFIATGSVAMNIKFLSPAFSSSCLARRL